VQKVIRGAILAAAALVGLATPVLAQGTPFYDWVVNADNQGSNVVPAGSLAGYIVKVENVGAAAPETVITVPVPPTTTFSAATGTITGCAVNVDIVSCTVPELQPGATAAMDIKFRTTAAGTITAVFNIAAPDAVPTNNTAMRTTTVAKGADIGLTITGPTLPRSGSRASYNVVVANTGPDIAERYQFDFPVPGGLAAVTTPSGCVKSGSSFLCTGTGLAVNALRTFTFTGTINANVGSTITLSSSILDSEPLDPDVDNNIAELDIKVTPGSDVKVSKSRAPVGDLIVGQKVTFTLVPSYSGDVPQPLKMFDDVPSNYTIDNVNEGSWECSTSDQRVTCEKDTVTTGPGLNVSLGDVTIEATATTETVAGATVRNRVEIESQGNNDSAPNLNDPDLNNNVAFDPPATILPKTIDLEAHKTGPTPPALLVGSTVTFQLSASNVGNVGYYGLVQIDEVIPVGLRIMAIGGQGWDCTPSSLPLDGTGTNFIPCVRTYDQGSPLAPTEFTPVINVTAEVTQAGVIVNKAQVKADGGNLPDNNSTNDIATWSGTGGTDNSSADLTIVKTISAPAAIPPDKATVASGGAVTFEIEVINNGTPNSVPDAPSELVTITDEFTQLINSSTGIDGGLEAFQIIKPAFPTMDIECSTSVTPGSKRSVKLTCGIDELQVCVPRGGSTTATCPIIRVITRPGGNASGRSNTATAISSKTYDPDMSNNSGKVDYEVTANTDVIVGKTATPSPVRVGQDLVYVVTARNSDALGVLSAADEVTITDTLPVGVTFISATPSRGTCPTTPAVGSLTTTSNRTVLCSFGTPLDAGVQQTVTITVRPTKDLLTVPQPILKNQVSVSTTTPEADQDNNSAEVDTPVIDARFDLLVDKTDTPDPVILGDNTVFTVLVQNRGPSAAENVKVVETLPKDILKFVAATTPGDADCGPTASLDPFGGEIQCTFPLLLSGETRVIEVEMEGAAVGVSENIVEVSAAGSAVADQLPGNNKSIETTTVRNRVDVEATSKVPSTLTPELGETFTFTIRVTNIARSGLSDAENVVLSDTLPAGMVMAGSPTATVVPGTGTASTLACTVKAANAGFDCNFGTMSAGAVVDVVAPVRVEVVTVPPPAAQTFTNTATVTTTSGDEFVGNDSAEGSVEVTNTAPKIALVKTAGTSGLSTPPKAGEVVTYAFTVTNTGGLTLRDVTLADSLPGMVISGGPIASLAPGAVDSTTFTGTYALTQADLDLGQVTNTAEVTGSYTTPTGGTDTVTDKSGTALDDNNPTVVDLPAAAAIAVVKTADTSQMTTPTQVGDLIIYRFAVTNTGNVTLTDVTLSDPLPGLTLTGGPIAALPPGVTDTTTFTGTYAVTQANLESEQVVNQATVSGNPPTGPPSTGLSGTSLTNTNPTVVALTYTPDVTATKTASTDSVIIGDSLTYTLTFTSNSLGTLRNVTVVDVLPLGLVYTPGTATVGGVAADPQGAGRTLRWTGLTIGPKQSLTVKLGVRVTGDAPWGELENQTWLEGSTGTRFSNVATAIIVREPEAVFDCADIIGKVFDDRNRNGTQDAPDGSGATEPGLPAVRVVTTRGYVITTDDFGRFHVPCAELPREMGSNFTMKLDTRSLPTGYRLTTENPRTIRVTPGKMAKVNFGVSLSRVVRIDLSAQAFTAEGQPTAALKKGVAGLIAQLQSEPSVLRLNYRLSGESDAVARKRLDRVEALVRSAWQDKGERLRVERTLQRAGGTP
jgi:uncharacterized repeat protein (TIGR01451 family)